MGGCGMLEGGKERPYPVKTKLWSVSMLSQVASAINETSSSAESYDITKLA